MRLADKIAVTTGAGSGMGKAMAELFVREGAKVVCADRSSLSVTPNRRDLASSAQKHVRRDR